MPTAGAPDRLARELTDCAAESAQVAGQSLAEQVKVSHWVQLGGERERSPEESAVDVQAVLRGTRPYDSLNAHEQTIVRAAWDASITARLARLDLAEAFMAEGHCYAELDEHGRLQVRGQLPASVSRSSTPST